MSPACKLNVPRLVHQLCLPQKITCSLPRLFHDKFRAARVLKAMSKELKGQEILLEQAKESAMWKS